MPDTVIAGRYKLEDLLGRGGMSEVYCAEDLELGRRVALKLLAPDADTARFEREARAVASLGHPNVMQLYDYGEDEGRPYMVLEYVPGRTLEERLAAANGKPLPGEETAGIAAGIAAGLAHAHVRGVIHRDLKPANVLFDDEGRPKLADFGIARMAAGEGTLTEAGTVLGTAAYISPEQAAGQPATAASDVYSFGVILYRMLTGRLPFESNDPMELVMMNRDVPPPPITSFRDDPPGRLEATATAALEKDPAGRPHNGGELLAALGVAGAGTLAAAGTAVAADATQVLPVTPSAGGPAAEAPAPTAAATEYVTPPPPPPRRSKAPLLAAILLVLLLAGGALAYEVTRSDSASESPPTTLPTIRISTPSTTTHSTSAPTTTQPATTPSTAAPTTSTTAPTTTQPTTSTHRTTTTTHTTTGATTSTHTTTTVPTTSTTAPPPPPTTQPTTFTQPGTTTTAP